MGKWNISQLITATALTVCFMTMVSCSWHAISTSHDAQMKCISTPGCVWKEGR